MYIVLPIDDFNIHNVFFSERQNNNVIHNCFFTHIYYSNDIFTLSNIVLHVDIPSASMDYMESIIRNTTYNRYQSEVSVYKIRSCSWIKKMIQLEKDLLQLFRNSKETNNVRYNLKHTLEKGTLHVTGKPNSTIVLRISGIWQDKMNNIGIIYKFIGSTTSNHQTSVLSSDCNKTITL